MRASRFLTSQSIRQSLSSVTKSANRAFATQTTSTTRPVSIAAAPTRIRQLASLAVKDELSQATEHPSSRARRSTVALENDLLDSRLEAVDELLRSGIGGSDVWAERLHRVREDLRSNRPRRIAVIGDDISGARDIVSSLLQDPISNSNTSRQALLTRHVDSNRSELIIGFDRKGSSTDTRLRLPLSWLEQNKCELAEISDGSETAVTATLAADHIVLVVDPIRLLSTDVASKFRSLITSGRPATIVINGCLPQNMTAESVRDVISQQGGLLMSENIEIIFTDSSLALEAFTALSDGLQRIDASPSTRSKAFEIFQHAYLKSNVGRLQSTLATSIGNFRLVTAASTLSMALDYIKATLDTDRQALAHGWQAVKDLRRSSRQAATHAKNTSVINRAIEGGRIEGGVDDELARARHDIQLFFDGKLSWLGLVGRLRVDDVGSEMGAYVAQRFGVELERQIVFETGQLSQLRRNLDLQTDATIRRMATLSVDSHPLSSPLLVNHLATLSLSIPDLSPTTLLLPLQQRRQQIVNVAVSRLQKSARHALLSTLTLAATGIFSSWWAYVPPVELLSASTAGALGVLSVVSAAALGQNRWGKAQSRFWQEWDRATGMLRGDLQENFVAALDTRVVAKTDAAADGLDRLLQKRQDKLDLLDEAVEREAAAIALRSK